MKRRTVVLAVLRSCAFLAFVWLCREFFAVGEVDGCLDDGGAVNHAVNICEGSRHGQWRMVSTGSYLSWLTSLGLPAALTLGLYALLSRWLVRDAR